MTAARRKSGAATVAREHGYERVTLAPVTVSQHTAPTVLGITDRQFLDALRKYRVPHAKIGKIRLVRVVIWLRFVEAHEETVVDETARSNEERVPSVDEVLSACGLRRGMSIRPAR